MAGLGRPRQTSYPSAGNAGELGGCFCFYVKWPKSRAHPPQPDAVAGASALEGRGSSAEGNIQNLRSERSEERSKRVSVRCWLGIAERLSSERRMHQR